MELNAIELNAIESNANVRRGGENQIRPQQFFPAPPDTLPTPFLFPSTVWEKRRLHYAGHERRWIGFRTPES
jgi:hypothetical protein